ncbi:MAG: hypothetical protein QXJ17_04595 [Nitrososphaeria archaeon]
MASRKLLIAIVIISITILSITTYLTFFQKVTKPSVSVNAYWLKTDVTLGESVTFVVKAANSNFLAQIWKEDISHLKELVAQYQGSGILSQSFTPLERSTYYIKVMLPDGTMWEQQLEYWLKVR